MSSAWISPMKIWHWILSVKKLSTDCLISDNNFQLLTYPSKPKPFDELNQIIWSLSIICMVTFGVWSSPFITYLYIRFQFWHLYIVSRGKMEYGGKMKHRVFWKKPAWCGSNFMSIWFLSTASSVWNIEIKLAIDHVLSIPQKRNFTFLINQFSNVLTSNALTNYVVEPLHVVRCNYIPLVLIFTSFDWATGDIIVDIMAFLQT